jgi:hypothetical protein
MHTSYAVNEKNIDWVVTKINTIIQNESVNKKNDIFNYFNQEINIRLSNNPNIQNRDEILYFKSQIRKSQFKLVSKNILKNISSHNALSLTFISWEDHNSKIHQNETVIKNTQSVFIFRWKDDLSRDEIVIITNEIKKINPEILIFIDQEWWLIHRFVDFPSTVELQAILDTFFVKVRMQSMSTESLRALNSLFDTKKLYFYPSLQDLWKSYSSIQDETSRKYFLEIAAYIRMNSLKNVWINTYGLVMDLDEWNPVISWHQRSFSSHVQDYYKLINAFILASEVNEMKLYWKHFPWHGMWDIDSHKWILDISLYPEYTQNNLDVFRYFISAYASIQKWIMVWHMYVWNTLLSEFNSILNDTQFIITDDLSMQWYLQATGKKLSQSFFTTDTLSWRNNLIKLWNTSNAFIK